MTLILLAAGWLAGIAAVALWGAPGWSGASLIAGCIAGASAWRGSREIATIGVCMVAAALIGGFLFARWDGRGTPDAARYLGRTVTFAGTMASEPDTSETSAGYVVNVRQVRTSAGWVGTTGRIRVSLGQYTRYLPGDRVELTGKLDAAPVFDDFDYRAYLARQDIVGTMYRPNVVLTAAASSTNFPAIVARARLRLDAALQRALPEPAASLADGIAFGRDGGMPGDLYDDFRTTGLAHIVAVSGSNVSVLAALAFALLIPALGRRWAVLPAGLLVGTYVVMAGASASVVRAGIMAAILLVGEWIGRPQSGLPGLAGAIVVMTAVQPSAAVDVGFQLSVAATAGLIAFGPWLRYLLQRRIRTGWGRVLPAWSIEATAITLAATFATLPLLWVNFGRVSLVSPVANVIVTPAVLVALPLAMATAVAGAISAPFGWLIGLVTYYPVAFIILVARGLASFPGASVPTPGVSGTVAAVAMLALSAGGWLCYRRMAPPIDESTTMPRWVLVAQRSALAGLGLIALGVIVRTSVVPIGGPGDFEMRALDIGQGDAILLTTPHGRTMLIDGGVSDMVLARQLGAVLPHWDRSIDIVFQTHPDADHVGGLPGVLRRFDVPNVWDTGVVGTSGDAAIYAAERGRTVIHEGDHFALDGVQVDVLWPPADAAPTTTNATCLVLRVTYGSTRFLLTGDLEGREQLKMMAAEDVRADVLKVPHHGSKTTDPKFLEAVGADVAVISVGAGNPYGHPAAQTINALAGETILRTDLDGRVTVHSDGTRVTWRTER